MGQFTNFRQFQPRKKVGGCHCGLRQSRLRSHNQCVSHGHVSYRYFISEASVLEVAFYLIIQSINFRRQLFCCRSQNVLISAYFYTIILLLYEFHSYYFFEKEKQLNGKNYRLSKTSTTIFPQSVIIQTTNQPLLAI